jgi:chromosome segregation ATPase
VEKYRSYQDAAGTRSRLQEQLESDEATYKLLGDIPPDTSGGDPTTIRKKIAKAKETVTNLDRDHTRLSDKLRRATAEKKSKKGKVRDLETDLQVLVTQIDGLKTYEREVSELPRNHEKTLRNALQSAKAAKARKEEKLQ